MANISTASLPFAKGHGTENDFIIVNDPEGKISLDADRVAALCDRRAGIGADGLLRVIRAQALVDNGEIDELAEGIAGDDWFMDYRNADGSIAEMCGNGTRVFAHWVVAQGLVSVPPRGAAGKGISFTVGTRAGAKPVTVHACDSRRADVSVEMGVPEVMGLSTAQMAGFFYAGLGVDMGNPHLAATIPGLDAEALAELVLEQPVYDAEFFPHGLNVEVVTPLKDGEVNMRVFERGVGETRSCGTGTVAAAVSALADAGAVTGSVTVNVPGGQVQVEVREDGSTLRGPSEIVATGLAAI
ncbi:diaminopimelate epimerase [Corynebacterium ammoniagenes]|uniref:Diaminopimelate epimerase n=2 Tax=Corynebacterium ammoniagenes TaxID=1697 RepID=A0AAV5G7M3_CORAM|nr:diaminopimelate epimerase [Corynebacterium ammoniagenes]APT82474.1 diaminopimelate epimerase [Corynebacterium ammoniagenes DSM 20306]AQS73555.1 diaminopimelate epimerase [Corynebacterium ammoniagenes]EFG82690.1 diaminopimelate epimerase [Corynebacterium ammoniagenes DSM 20306]NMF30914.1 diaminopimelate epimerase [Corynebacterium ammoniagenes]GJN42305.1 diaminopimelate epimerase [Corynebacterium ammoniagenes]